uniref:Uncharacterized protein n=1 Tax=Oryza nivara TaxID=4536 RepID=A0A0E0J3E9_ORYNI
MEIAVGALSSMEYTLLSGARGNVGFLQSELGTMNAALLRCESLESLDVQTPSWNRVVSAKPAAFGRSEAEPRSVRLLAHKIRSVPCFLCRRHNLLRCRLAARAETSQDNDASCSFFPGLRLGRGGDPRPLRPLAEEAATQWAGSDESKSVQGKRERGRRCGSHGWQAMAEFG